MSRLSDEILHFNPASPTVMHIDINSCFATIEQQANPFFRGKPVAVAAYDSPGGCILAASVEAKKLYGVKTGMRVKEGKERCPELIVVSPDANKYRHVHLQLRHLLSCYTDKLYPKSIDEFVLHLEGYPALRQKSIYEVGLQIKKRIKEEIGEWITVSIGTGPSRFTAKMAAGLKKPDGLEELSARNYLDVYQGLELEDLHGIASRNARRLQHVGIFSVMDFYASPLWKIRAAFKSVNAYYWFLRLRGWEIDQEEYERKSYGNSYALPKPFVEVSDLAPILSKLVNKATFRMRQAGYQARGVHLSVAYRDWKYWHQGHLQKKWLFDTRDIYAEALRLLNLSPRRPVRILAVSCFELSTNPQMQTELYDDVPRKKMLTEAMDTINEKWGNFVITPANMLTAKEKHVHDRIAFGGVKELVL